MNGNYAAQGVLDYSVPLSYHPQGNVAPTQPNSAVAVNQTPALPRSIRHGGPIQQCLENARGRTEDPRRFDKLASDLSSLRQQAVPRVAAVPADNGNDALASCLPNLGPGSDAVLRYVIADQEDLKAIVNMLQPGAEKAYLQAPHFYRSVFGDLLPGAFHERVDKQVYANGANPTAADDMDVFFRRLEGRRQVVEARGQVGLPSGIAALDEALSGFHGLTFLTGPKGAGKTSLALSVVWETLNSQSDVAALIYSLDLSKDRIYDRLLCRAAGTSYRALTGVQESTGQEEERLDDAKRTVRELAKRLRVVERDHGYEEVTDNETGGRWLKKGLSYHQIAGDCNSLLRATGAQQLLIFIDMLSKWDLPGSADSKTDPDPYRLDVFDRLRQESRRAFAHDGFVILATSELRKDTDKELTIDDVKGDGRIGSDADNVLLIWPMKNIDNLSDEPVPVNLRIAKTRDGGRRGDVRLLFDHVHYRFTQAGAEPDRAKPRRRAPPTTVNPFGS
jgi:hypothetical protein